MDASMTKSTDRDEPEAAAASTAESQLDDAAQLIEEELLVEEVSIDGMCGVY